MWTLYNLNDLNAVYYLPSGRSYTIGRKETDIVIVKDPSVSRNHATITFKDDDSVVYCDLKSKFGSKVNNNVVKISSQVKENDIIMVGQGPTSLRLSKTRLAFCCSNMSMTAKKEVESFAKQLGGSLLGSWSSSCTHLVMESVTVTVKVVNALSSCSPIITPQWLKDSVKHFKLQKPLPLCKSYQPPITDSNLRVDNEAISLDPSSTRRKLFKDKTVYFIDKKQYSNLKYCLLSAESVIKSITLDTPPNAYCADDCIVIDPGKQPTNPSRDVVEGELAKHGLRFIPEAEVGHAFLIMSIDKFCNPKFEIDTQLSNPIPPGSLSQAPESYFNEITFYNTQSEDSTILAPNTQLSQMGVASNSRLQSKSDGVSKIDETLIKEEPAGSNGGAGVNNELDSALFDDPVTDIGTGNAVRVKPEPNDDTQKPMETAITSQVKQSSCSASLQSNATILATDSLPPSLPAPHDSSVRLPDKGIITNAFKDRKRNRNSVDENQSDSRSKRSKAEPQTTRSSIVESSANLISIGAVDPVDVEENRIESRPRLPVTPPPPSVNNENGFLSARKRTPVKSQTVSRNEKTRTSPKGLALEDIKPDTENPLPYSTPIQPHLNTNNDRLSATPNASTSKVVSSEGFINARRKPVVVKPVKKIEQEDSNEPDTDFSSYPPPIVECIDLFRKRQPISHSQVHSDGDTSVMANVVNFKKFKKAATIGSGTSNFKRLIGGSADFTVHVVTTNQN